MNALLLKRVEELTFYLFEKDEQLKSGGKDISELKKQVEKLTQQKQKKQVHYNADSSTNRLALEINWLSTIRRKITIFLAARLTTIYSYAQNTFPTSGNLEIVI